MRLFVGLLLALSCTLCFARQPYTVINQVTIHTGDWYPLSTRDMKAAAVDTALSEFTGTGQFRILPATPPAATPADGRLDLAISLIGPAEVLKLTAALHLQDQPSYVASVSLDIHGMDYQGIYNAFEFVGRETAKRLNAKLQFAQVAQAPTPDREASDLFNQAQALKREGRYHEARARFEALAERTPATQWSALAADELRYGLPLYEADNILPDHALQASERLLEQMTNVSHLYRQILADNGDQPQRVVDINQRLDQVALSLKHLRNAITANALSRATTLRILVMEQLMQTGQWPAEKHMRQLLQQQGDDYELVRYEHSATEGDLVILDQRYDVMLQLSGDERRVTLQPLTRQPAAKPI
ncbi:MAG: hypothetical protein VYA55_20340 [Pseudomonadota bacterium]|nr:hypothetical protein [Pseudomonadota bacterium]